MKTLNLTNLDTSDIKYHVSRFPDGQQQVKITGNSENCIIKSRLNNFLDLELIICTVASLRELGITEIHLYVPYFVGARSDRKFEKGSNNYLSNVICPIINSLKLTSITVLDPHSHVLEACLNRFRTVSNLELVKWSINELSNIHKHVDDIILVSPDAGATHKIYKLAEQIGYKGDIITCSKERDNEGKLTRTVVPGLDTIDIRKDCIIIDDICDGGRTFINIAKVIKENHDSVSLKDKKGKLYLIVTHGIFSAGFGDLIQYFDGIYCTNSYRDLEFEFKGPLKDKVKQLNVF